MKVKEGIDHSLYGQSVGIFKLEDLTDLNTALLHPQPRPIRRWPAGTCLGYLELHGIFFWQSP